MRACGIVLGLAGILAASGCGGGAPTGRLHVTSLTLSAANGFPGPPTTAVTLNRGRTFGRIARLVPLPLPPKARHPVGPSQQPTVPTKRPSVLTVCFPMDLTIGLSNGKEVSYPSCYRPRSLRPVVKAMCPLLRKPGFCAYYRNELE